MNRLYIGIDNGTTGTIGFVGDGFYRFYLTPSKKEQSYTKAKNIISRIDANLLRALIEETIDDYFKGKEWDVMVVMERPLINPTMFKTSMNASRALEATLVVVESLNLPHMYTDSKAWQRDVLPKGTEGTTELKKASLDIATRLYPNYEKMYKSHKDGDGILIAHWARQSRF